MKIKQFNKLQDVQWSGQLIGVGIKQLATFSALTLRLNVVCAWEIYYGFKSLKLWYGTGLCNPWLIVFFPKSYFFGNYENYADYAKEQASAFKLVKPKYFIARSKQVFVLESCPAIKLPHILQSAFPDANFAWKPSSQWWGITGSKIKNI